MPERPKVSSDWYDAALGRSPRTIAIERPDRSVPAAHEIVRATTFTEPTVREWAGRATQIDVLDYEIVVLHEPRGPVPATIEVKLAPPERSAPDVVREGLVDGRWAFVLRDGTWVFAAMGYVDRVRVLLARSRPPRLAIPNDTGQLVLVTRPSSQREGLEWILIVTKIDGGYVTHAHYTSEAAVEVAPRVSTPDTIEAYQHGQEFYSRGF